MPGSIETIKRLLPLTNIGGFTDIHAYRKKQIFKKELNKNLLPSCNMFPALFLLWFPLNMLIVLRSGIENDDMYLSKSAQQISVALEFNSPSNRTRGLSKNISLQDVYGTSLIQLLPQTFKQAKRHISGSLGNKCTTSIYLPGKPLSALRQEKHSCQQASSIQQHWLHSGQAPCWALGHTDGQGTGPACLQGEQTKNKKMRQKF